MKIMVCYRETKTEIKLLDRAVIHAKAFKGIILLVTSMRGGEEIELKEFTRAEEALEKAKEFCENQGIKAETKLLVRGRSAGEDLLQFSREEKPDEIMIGIKSRSKVGKLLFGSTAQSVILKANCPVLCVK
jgi:nucleotide-binding universal stress UspA family protein